MFGDDIKPDWTADRIIGRTIDGAKIVTAQSEKNLFRATQLEVYWGKHKGSKWLYACDDMFALGVALKHLKVPEPDYRHRFALRSLRLSAPQSALTLVVTFSIFRASGADRIADALGLFTLLTTRFEFSSRAVAFALSRLEGFESCRYRIPL